MKPRGALAAAAYGLGLAPEVVRVVLSFARFASFPQYLAETSMAAAEAARAWENCSKAPVVIIEGKGALPIDPRASTAVRVRRARRTKHNHPRRKVYLFDGRYGACPKKGARGFAEIVNGAAGALEPRMKEVHPVLRIARRIVLDVNGVVEFVSFATLRHEWPSGQSIVLDLSTKNVELMEAIEKDARRAIATQQRDAIVRPIARSRNARVFLKHSAPYVDALTPTDRGSVWLTSAQCVYDDLHATWSIRLCGEVLHVYDREGSGRVQAHDQRAGRLALLRRLPGKFMTSFSFRWLMLLLQA